jgi:hypothetical protein
MDKPTWEKCTDPVRMLRHLQPKAPKRKLHLFSVACIREQGHLLTEPRSREAYFLAERFAEGQASLDELRQAHARAKQSWMLLRGRDSFWREGDFKICCRMIDVAYALTNAIDPELEPLHQACRTAMSLQGSLQANVLPLCARDMRWGLDNQELQANLLRDIFGNPFKRPRLDRTWFKHQAGDAARIAASIYDDRSFDELPILADALMDAECPHEELIAHCQSPGVHGRGCWVVDLLMGKR